jgi:hypothetical protein
MREIKDVALLPIKQRHPIFYLLSSQEERQAYCTDSVVAWKLVHSARYESRDLRTEVSNVLIKTVCSMRKLSYPRGELHNGKSASF